MTTESLKMVMDMISQLGANGKEAFIWYLLCAEVLPCVVGAVVGLTVVYAGYRVVCALLPLNACYGFFKRIRDENRIGCVGILTDTEQQAVERLLNQRLANVNEKGENK